LEEKYAFYLCWILLSLTLPPGAAGQYDLFQQKS
jgi:hypothetical protein